MMVLGFKTKQLFNSYTDSERRIQLRAIQIYLRNINTRVECKFIVMNEITQEEKVEKNKGEVNPEKCQHSEIQ